MVLPIRCCSRLESSSTPRASNSVALTAASYLKARFILGGQRGCCGNHEDWINLPILRPPCSTPLQNLGVGSCGWTPAAPFLGVPQRSNPVSQAKLAPIAMLRAVSAFDRVHA